MLPCGRAIDTNSGRSCISDSNLLSLVMHLEASQLPGEGSSPWYPGSLRTWSLYSRCCWGTLCSFEISLRLGSWIPCWARKDWCLWELSWFDGTSDSSSATFASSVCTGLARSDLSCSLWCQMWVCIASFSSLRNKCSAWSWCARWKSSWSRSRRCHRSELASTDCSSTWCAQRMRQASSASAASPHYSLSWWGTADHVRRRRSYRWSQLLHPLWTSFCGSK